MNKSIILPKSEKHFSWKCLAWLLLYFCYFSTVLQMVIFFTGYSGTNGLRDSLLFSSLWLIPSIIFPAHVRIIAAISGVLLWGTSLPALIYYLIYGHEFSQSVLFVMFETNADEASEYLFQYLSFKICIVAMVYSVIAFLLWTRIRPVYIPVLWRFLVSFALLYGLLIHPVVVNTVFRQLPLKDTLNKLTSRMEPAAPWQFISGYYQYQQQLSSLNILLDKNNSLPPLSDLNDKSGNAPRTLVLIIGESTQRGRMSLYGYPRKTTPELDALKKSDINLKVFNNVISSRPYTIEMLQQALTFANQQYPELWLTRPSLMNLMKQAGYKTFWITNQQAMTERNTLLTAFSRQTDKQYYMNQQRTQSSREYDSNVLAPFKDVLRDPAERKFIVVHLLGTHIKYKYRYPDEWGVFDDRTDFTPPGLSRSELETYNDYDNANLYNDYIVATLIKSFRDTDPNGFLLYFSDHGEDVYDTPPHNILGRNEDHPTRPMFTVPFLLWVSDKWQATHPRNFSPYIDRGYSTAELIHTWSDLSGLSYDGYDPSRSIVNPDFRETIRWIGNPYKKYLLFSFDSLPH